MPSKKALFRRRAGNHAKYEKAWNRQPVDGREWIALNQPHRKIYCGQEDEQIRPFDQYFPAMQQPPREE